MKQHTDSPNWDDIEKGTEIRIDGVSGVFRFVSSRIERDGQRVVTVWGGDRKPTGIRMMRSFYADRCRVYRPRVDHRKMVDNAKVFSTQRKGKR